MDNFKVLAFIRVIEGGRDIHKMRLNQSLKVGGSKWIQIQLNKKYRRHGYFGLNFVLQRDIRSCASKSFGLVCECVF